MMLGPDGEVSVSNVETKGKSELFNVVAAGLTGVLEISSEEETGGMELLESGLADSEKVVSGIV